MTKEQLISAHIEDCVKVFLNPETSPAKSKNQLKNADIKEALKAGLTKEQIVKAFKKTLDLYI